MLDCVVDIVVVFLMLTQPFIPAINSTWLCLYFFLYIVRFDLPMFEDFCIYVIIFLIIFLSEMLASYNEFGSVISWRRLWRIVLVFP